MSPTRSPCCSARFSSSSRSGTRRMAAIGLLWRYNPLFDATPLEGGPILNTLILGYLIPALIAGTLAFLARKPRPFWYWGSAAALSLILAFAFLILELRVLFHGQMIDVSLGA